MFFKIESWNFQHLFEIEFRETSQNFNSISSFRKLLFSFFYRFSDWLEILRDFMKFWKFYLEKQKSFIPKNLFLSRCQYQNKKALFTDPIFSEGFGSRFKNNKECLLTYHLVPRAIRPYYVKWNFSTFCGLSRSTTYPCLPQGRIGPLDPHSYPQVEKFHFT